MSSDAVIDTCPLCASEGLQNLTRSHEVSEGGCVFVVHDLEYSVCADCGGKTTTPAQSRRNKRKIIAAHKRAAGLLSGDQIKEIREVYLNGLTQKQMAQLLGVGINTFSRYETDSVVQSDAMNSLLLVLGEHPEVVGTLARHQNVTLSEQTTSKFTTGWLKNFTARQAEAANHTSSKVSMVVTPNTIARIQTRSSSPELEAA